MANSKSLKKGARTRGRSKSAGIAARARAAKTAKKPRMRVRVSAPTPPKRPAPSTVFPVEAPVSIRAEVPRIRGTGRVAALWSLAGGSSLSAVTSVSVSEPPRRRMIVLPPRGLRATGSALEATTAGTLLALFGKMGAGHVTLGSIGSLALGLSPSVSSSTTLSVVDSIAENGAKLVEYNPGDEGALRAALPGLRLVPEVFYEPLSLRLSLESNLEPSGSGSSVAVTVKSSVTGKPVRGVKIVGFTNFALRFGAQAFTDAKGEAVLPFASKPSVLERVYGFVERGFWSALRMSVSTANVIDLKVVPIDLTQPHALSRFFGTPPPTTGQGVSVGVIDTGCGPHPDIVITDGLNAVHNENPADFGDNGDLHGTHVAGIIAARGSTPTGIRGIAPGVSLFSYRVFAKGANASNFDIARAIDAARAHGCDLLNLSLGRPADVPTASDEPLVRFALEDAREGGILTIAAAGNDFRKDVSFPAADDLCIAVSALGHRRVLQAGTPSAAAFIAPPGTDQDEFIGDFSNVGPQIDLTAPGVGITSTVPPADFAVMDGTSMACPAVTGIAARLLGNQSSILGMTRGPARSAAIAQLLLGAAQTRGFTPEFEGRGLPV